MKKIKDFLLGHLQILILGAGFCLVTAVAFRIGEATGIKKRAPEIRIEEAFSITNNSLNEAVPQSEPAPAKVVETGDCQGKIKGNINSKGDKTYHVPGSSFYARTKAEICFDSEKQALEMGFRKAGK